MHIYSRAHVSTEHVLRASPRSRRRTFVPTRSRVQHDRQYVSRGTTTRLSFATTAKDLRLTGLLPLHSAAVNFGDALLGTNYNLVYDPPGSTTDITVNQCIARGFNHVRTAFEFQAVPAIVAQQNSIPQTYCYELSSAGGNPIPVTFPPPPTSPAPGLFDFIVLSAALISQGYQYRMFLRQTSCTSTAYQAYGTCLVFHNSRLLALTVEAVKTRNSRSICRRRGRFHPLRYEPLYRYRDIKWTMLLRPSRHPSSCYRPRRPFDSLWPDLRSRALVSSVHSLLYFVGHSVAFIHYSAVASIYWDGNASLDPTPCSFMRSSSRFVRLTKSPSLLD